MVTSRAVVGNWSEHLVSANCAGAMSACADDIDGDGDMDIVGAGMTYPVGGYMDWWENTGEGVIWERHLIGPPGTSVHTSDVDGDGDIDVLGVNPLLCWWEVVGYPFEGSLESSILDTQIEPVWQYLDWNSQMPGGTSISCMVRASDTYKDMGEWSDSLHEPCSLEGILSDADRYMQYKIIFRTPDPDTTPTLSDITVSWYYLNIGDTAEPNLPEIELFPFVPNPWSAIVVRFGLSEPATVEISIFDLSGRLIRQIQADEYSPGYHDILLGDWSPGIYFCRMTSGEYSATQRFVVIE